jgi:hypothetical protein
MSTEKTRAPSFARSAASGRPTTSDLDVYVCYCSAGIAWERKRERTLVEPETETVYLLMTVIVRP